MGDFVITELRRPGRGGIVATPMRFAWTARAHSKPHTGIETPLSVNTVRKELPGTTEPVEQIISSAWQPFTITGTWDDKWAGRGFAANTYQDVSAMVARVPFVQFQWGSYTFKGVITNFTPRHFDKSKIGYTITLSPHRASAGAPTPFIPRNPPRPTKAYADEVAEITVKATEIHGRAKNLPFNDDTHTSLLEDLDAWTSSSDEIVAASRIQDIEDASRWLRRQSFRFTTLANASSRIIGKLGRVRSDVVGSYETAVNSLALNEWARGLAYQARLMIGVSVQADRDLKRRADAKPTRLYRPSAYENIYKVADTVYGAAAEWRAIFDANNLQSLTFDGTEELVIPERAGATA